MKNKEIEISFKNEIDLETVKAYEKDIQRQKQLDSILNLDFEKRNDLTYLCPEFIKSFIEVYRRKKIGGFELISNTAFLNSELEILKVKYLVSRINKNLSSIEFIPQDCKEEFIEKAKLLPKWTNHFGQNCYVEIFEDLK